MDLTEWRKTRRVSLELPSGLSVIVQDVTIMDLAIDGHIPAPLVSQFMASGKTDINLAEIDWADFGNMLNSLAKIAIVAPLITDEPSENTLGIKELSMADKMAVFEWCDREVRTVENFRNAGKPAHTAPTGRRVRSKAK